MPSKETLKNERANEKVSFIPPFEYARFLRTAVITFVIGLIIFLVLFFYIATH